MFTLKCTGCGGYVHGDGLITFSPHIFSWKNMSKITDCKWYVESEQDEQTVFLKKVTGEAQNKNQMFFHNLVPTLNVIQKNLIILRILYDQFIFYNYKKGVQWMEFISGII